MTISIFALRLDYKPKLKKKHDKYSKGYQGLWEKGDG